MHKPPITKHGSGIIFYRERLHYFWEELLVCLPEEMLAAQKQIGANVRCYGEFDVSPSGVLCCRFNRAPEYVALYRWSPTLKKWMQQTS